MNKGTIAVIAIGFMMVSLVPMALTQPWWENHPVVSHSEPEHIKGEVVTKEPQNLNPESCWQLGLRTLAERQIKWVCVSEADWKKFQISSTYSR